MILFYVEEGVQLADGLVCRVHDGFTHVSGMLEGIVRRLDSSGIVDQRTRAHALSHGGPRLVELFLLAAQSPGENIVRAQM